MQSVESLENPMNIKSPLLFFKSQALGIASTNMYNSGKYRTPGQNNWTRRLINLIAKLQNHVDFLCSFLLQRLITFKRPLSKINLSYFKHQNPYFIMVLKGISPLISPSLLKVLAEMGHGDEIVLADAHFPSHSICPPHIPVIRADGIQNFPYIYSNPSLKPR